MKFIFYLIDYIGFAETVLSIKLILEYNSYNPT